MKITSHILSVTTNGESLAVTAQGFHGLAANWRPWTPITFLVPDTARNRRSYRIGRHFTLKIKMTKE